MELLASAAQQGAVGGILHQRVLEGVLGIRRRPAPEDQLGALQLLQRIIQLLLRHSGDGADQLVGELPPERRADLRHLARRRQAIEPRQQRGLERRRDRQRQHGPVTA